MKNFLFALMFVPLTSFPMVGNIFLPGVTTILPSIITLGPDVLDAKAEYLREEAILHLAIRDVTDMSQMMKMFLTEVKKDKRYSQLTDLEILELFIDQN